MKKCGKNWDNLKEIDKIQVVPHFRDKNSSYMQSYLRLRDYTPSHIQKQQHLNKNISKIGVTEGNLYTFRLYNIL